MAPVLTRPHHRRLSDGAPPPDPRDPGGHGGGDWALLTVAANQVIAYLIRGRLAQEGIEVVLDSSNASPGAWLHPFGDPASPVRVFVRRAQLTEASLLLHEVDQASEAASRRLPTGLQLTRRLEGRLGSSSWIGFRVLVAVAAALALSGLLVFGPCVSHWFCV
jgi:Putative prokaryotic signal transducing protein